MNAKQVIIEKHASLTNPDILKSMQSDSFKVSVFGSARIQPDSEQYQEVYTFGKKIALQGWDVITGGGPGVMEAASAGHDGVSKEISEAESIGINIVLPFEQKANPYLDIVNDHQTFSTRLDEFMLLSDAFVVTMGGIGTCLELFYAWQLMQVRHICRTPIICVGEQWVELKKWAQKNLLEIEGGPYINADDLDWMLCVGTHEEAIEALKEAARFKKRAGAEACINIKQYSEALKNLGYSIS